MDLLAVDVQEAIESHRPGDRLELKLLRDNVTITLTVELGRRPPPQRSPRAAHVIDVLQVRPGQVIGDHVYHPFFQGFRNRHTVDVEQVDTMKL